MNSVKTQVVTSVVVTSVIVAFALSLGACTTNTPEKAPSSASDSASGSNVPAPVPNCSAPAQIPDIWVLEPMLVKQGKINSEMTKEQKEAVIREYIRAKNEQYTKCKKGKF